MTLPTDAIAETIRQGLAPDATAEQRQAAAQVCRAALAVFEPVPAATPASPSIGASALPVQPGDHVGQLLDALIARLQRVPPRRATTPAPAPAPPTTSTPAAAARPSRVPFVPCRGRKP